MAPSEKGTKQKEDNCPHPPSAEEGFQEVAVDFPALLPEFAGACSPGSGGREEGAPVVALQSGQRVSHSQPVTQHCWDVRPP